jgi:tRNA dimethylallyltransferase
VMRALGVRPLIQQLSGDLDLEVAIAAAKAETRQFIKRQQTWFKGNMSAWKAISTQQIECILVEIMPLIES